MAIRLSQGLVQCVSGQRCQPGVSPQRCVLCPGGAGRVVSLSALCCPPSQLSLKWANLGLPCNPSRTGCGKKGTRVKMGIYPAQDLCPWTRAQQQLLSLSLVQSSLSEGLSHILWTRSLSTASPRFVLGPSALGEMERRAGSSGEHSEHSLGLFFAHDS